MDFPEHVGAKEGHDEDRYGKSVVCQHLAFTGVQEWADNQTQQIKYTQCLGSTIQYRAQYTPTVRGGG